MENDIRTLRRIIEALGEYFTPIESPVTTHCAQGTGELRGLQLGGSWRISVNIYRIVSCKAADFAFTFLTNMCKLL